MIPMPDTEVFFVIDGPRREAQACLLAPTLAQFLTDNQRAVAYVPANRFDDLNEMTREVLDACGVEIRVIPGTEKGIPGYSATLLAIAAPRTTQYSVLLATEHLLIRSIDFASELGSALIGALPSDQAPDLLEPDLAWATFLEAFNLSSERRPENFGLGLVVMRERTDDGQPTQIGQDWLHTARAFAERVKFDVPRGQIERFALPILGLLRGQPVKVLRSDIVKVLTLDGLVPKSPLSRYRSFGTLWAQPLLARLALDCLAAVYGPQAEDDFLTTFGPTGRRHRFGVHLPEMAEPRSNQLLASARRAAANPKKERHH